MVRFSKINRFPFFKAFLDECLSKPGHYALDLSEDDPILPAIEYSLSLKDVSGFEDKKKDFLNCPINIGGTNEGIRQWASICAEFGAIFLLGKELGLPIVGFDKTSPRASTRSKKCDIVALHNGKLTFFEVKRNSKRDSQKLPDRLRKALDDFDAQYDLTAQLIQRDYDCGNLNGLISALKKHVDDFHREKEDEPFMNQDLPSPFVSPEVEIFFNEKSQESSGSYFFEESTLEDLQSFLLGSGRIGKDGKPMIPKVKEAEEQGADYLMCRIPSGYAFDTIVRKCFKELCYRNHLTYFIRDVHLGSLLGVILFIKYNNFCVVNNLRSRNQNWISV